MVKVILDDRERPDLRVVKVLAELDGWRLLLLSNGQRVTSPIDPAADPADCPLGFLWDKAERGA